jgi:hypothetical protein
MKATTNLHFTPVFSACIAFIKRAFYYANEYRFASMLIKLLLFLSPQGSHSTITSKKGDNSAEFRREWEWTHLNLPCSASRDFVMFIWSLLRSDVAAIKLSNQSLGRRQCLGNGRFPEQHANRNGVKRDVRFYRLSFTSFFSSLFPHRGTR